jgi:DNA repair protein SbcD/Mre11
MRVFHTADWHLGQTFHEYDRDHEHACFLNWLLNEIQSRKPEALLVSGDVFDSVNPPASAQRMYYEFLKQAADAHSTLQIVVTAGNHDAAARLEAPAPLLHRFNVTVVGTVERNADAEIHYPKFLVPLRNAAGEVAAIVLAVPFLRTGDLPPTPGVADVYTAGVAAFYQRLTEQACVLRNTRYPGAVLIGMGHCHLSEGAESRDSERRLVVGGLESLSTAAFPPELCYVALGHLHKPQTFDDGRVQYSGSPIPLSFTERSYHHRVCELEFGAAGLLSQRSLEIPRAVPLLSLPEGRAISMDALEALLKKADYGAAELREKYPFLEVRYLDDGPDPQRRYRIEQALVGKPVRLATTKFEPKEQPASVLPSGTDDVLGDLRSIDPLAVLLAAYRERYEGGEPEPALLSAFREVLSEVNE